jgi:hypothetical protein
MTMIGRTLFVNRLMLFLWPTAGDPQEVAGWIEDPEVCQTPHAALEILFQWPSRRYDPVALSHDVIYLKHQFHANGRPPFSRCRRKWLLGGPDVDRATPQCDIRILIAALILRNAETQDSSVKVDDDIEILRKDFTPQRHNHLRMIAHPSPRAAIGGNAGTRVRSCRQHH